MVFSATSFSSAGRAMRPRAGAPVVTRMPFGTLAASAFFLLLFVAALGSAISLLELVVALVRRQDPERKLDSFLVAGLIEARSHERMALLAAHSPDPELRQLYGDLLASEARHFGLYWVLCEARFPRAQVVERLEQLAEAEAAILAPLHPQPRMHS